VALHFKLENVAVSDVLSLKAARRDAITNIKCFGPGTLATQFRWFHLHSLCGATLFGSDRTSVIYLLPFGKVWLGFVYRVQRLATKQKAEFLYGKPN